MYKLDSLESLLTWDVYYICMTANTTKKIALIMLFQSYFDIQDSKLYG